jgi:uncharacterized protein
MQVETAEEQLRELGVHRFRVRHHGTVARIEIAPEEMADWLAPSKLKEISARVRAAGFQFVSIDCDGYRSGALNEVLPFEVLLAASGSTASRSKAG